MLIEYLPEFLRDFEEIKIIAKIEDDLFSALREDLRAVFDAGFANYASCDYLKRLEKLFGIIPKGGDSLEKRRLAVLSKLLERAPYTKITLDKALTSMLGNGGYTLLIDCEKFILTVRLSLTVQEALSAVREFLSGYVPANILIDLDLAYNRHCDLEKYCYSELEARAHEFLRRGVL